MQFHELGFSLLQDGNLRVGVLPKCEEILIRSACFDGFTLRGECTSDFKMCEGADGRVQNNSAVVQNLLELGCRFAASPCHQVGLTTQVDGKHRVVSIRAPKFIRNRLL